VPASGPHDYEAIVAWLSTKREGSATRRAYRKEAERYLLWAIVPSLAQF